MIEFMLITLKAVIVLAGWWWLIAHKLELPTDRPFKRKPPLL